MPLLDDPKLAREEVLPAVAEVLLHLVLVEDVHRDAVTNVRAPGPQPGETDGREPVERLGVEARRVAEHPHQVLRLHPGPRPKTQVWRVEADEPAVRRL
jgi:hypothetical protein